MLIHEKFGRVWMTRKRNEARIRIELAKNICM